MGQNDHNPTTIPPALIDICDGHTKRVKMLVQIRTNYIFNTIFNYISSQIENAFTASDLQLLSITICLDPDYSLNKMHVIHRYPKNSRVPQCQHDVEFEPYTGDDAEFAQGRIFRELLEPALSTRLINELNFTATSNKPHRYEFTFDMSTLYNAFSSSENPC